MRSTSVYEPAPHGVGDEEPVVQLLPAGHGLHCLAADRLVAEENAPAGHGSGADAHFGQNDPLMHSMQPVAPDCG